VTPRCSAAALERGDQLAGTATMVRSFLLVEAPVPWGEVALRDSRLPDDAKAWLRETAATTRVRVLLIRRPGRTTAGSTRVFAVRTGVWCETAELDDVRDVVGLDLAALAAGRSPGLRPFDGRLMLVCTPGRHDACGAERGRPLAAALSRLRPDDAWECSHLGGDRFAGNLLVLPAGLGFGRVTPEDLPRLLGDLDDGSLPLDLLRGRATIPMAAQFAEVRLRELLDERRTDAVRCSGFSRDGDLWHVAFDTASTTYDVDVRVSGDEPALLTCSARRANAVPRHEVVAITTR
jgi:hypothetical protein